MSVSWNPWHGCRKLSEGCRHCYVYRQDAQHDKDSREVRRTTAFNLPVRRTRDGRYKVPPGEMVYTCFTSDFLVEEADAWRAEAWEMIRIRSDLRFFFITKRIDRLMQVLPPDWGGGYENLAVGCTVENQAMADYRLDRFEALMTAAAVRYLGTEVPEPACDAGMLERFMREIYAMRPMPTRTLPKLYFKLFSPIHNRWRLRRVLRTSPWRYYYDTIRAQWNERFTLFR